MVDEVVEEESPIQLIQWSRERRVLVHCDHELMRGVLEYGRSPEELVLNRLGHQGTNICLHIPAVDGKVQSRLP